MGKFVEQYVRVPLVQVDQSTATLLPLSITDHGTAINVQLGTHQFTIQRVRPEDQIEDADDSDDE